MKPEVRDFLKHSTLELVVYAVLVIAYFFLVLHFIGGWLLKLFHENRTEYAFVALGLIVAQGVALELLTAALLRLVRSGRSD